MKNMNWILIIGIIVVGFFLIKGGGFLGAMQGIETSYTKGSTMSFYAQATGGTGPCSAKPTISGPWGEYGLVSKALTMQCTVGVPTTLCNINDKWSFSNLGVEGNWQIKMTYTCVTNTPPIETKQFTVTGTCTPSCNWAVWGTCQEVISNGCGGTCTRDTDGQSCSGGT